jgi:hypothetical protein
MPEFIHGFGSQGWKDVVVVVVVGNGKGEGGGKVGLIANNII